VGNVNLPTPVVLAGAGLCLLGGYLVGVVAGPEGPDRTTGTVQSYDSSSNSLCLEGDGVEDLDGAKDGVLCGVWEGSEGARTPRKGDHFRFVSRLDRNRSGAEDDRVVIFGEVDD
jgi:hypothetical protein